MKSTQDNILPRLKKINVLPYSAYFLLKKYMKRSYVIFDLDFEPSLINTLVIHIFHIIHHFE